jgi:hypothetical protein
MEALYDQFDDRYLGVKASDPTVDNDGNALQAGAFYISSATGFIRAYNGTAWVQGISAIAGVTSIDGQTGDVVLDVPGQATTAATAVVNAAVAAAEGRVRFLALLSETM